MQGRSSDTAGNIARQAAALEELGAFAIVLECVPAKLAREISEKLRIPTIGIGAGVDCDGQILVFTDLVGLTFGHTAKFVRQYADVKSVMADALQRYADDVKTRQFPAEAESYHLPEGVAFTILEEEHSQSMPPLGPIN